MPFILPGPFEPGQRQRSGPSFQDPGPQLGDSWLAGRPGATEESGPVPTLPLLIWTLKTAQSYPGDRASVQGAGPKGIWKKTQQKITKMNHQYFTI